MSDTDLDEKRLEAAAKATHPEAFDPPPHWTNGDIAWAKEMARDQARAAIRAYNAAEGVGAVAWLDMRKEPAPDWRERVVAVNPEYVANNGPEHFAPLYTHPAPASAGVTTEGTRLTYYAELRRELEVLLAARPAPSVEG